MRQARSDASANRAAPGAILAGLAVLSLFLAGILLIHSAQACPMGFTEGYPRPLAWDRDKAGRLEDMRVRAFPLNGGTLYLPVPPGFIDIEMYSQDALPDWLHIDAMNLREHKAVLARNPDLSLVPEFSRLEIAFQPYKSLEPGQADPAGCADALAFLRGERPDLPAWAEGVADVQARGGEHVFCEDNPEGAQRALLVRTGYGGVDVKAREEAYARAAEEQRRFAESVARLREAMGKAREQAIARGESFDENEFLRHAEPLILPDGIPPGTTFHTSHSAAVCTLTFPFKNQHLVTVSAELGPADSPEELKKAFDAAARWKKAFLAVN